MTRLRAILAIASTFAFVLWCAAAAAQAWPQRPVKVIVPFVAGGNTDNQARIVSERLASALGQPFVVENRVGAGGAIAAEFVAKSPPDGYTLFFAASPQFSLPLVQKVSFDPYNDFAPVSIVGTNPFVLGIHTSIPAKTVKEFVEYVKARPGQLNYASAGNGTTTHLTGALFLTRAGLQMTHIPYKGGAQAVSDLVGGQVQMYFGNASELIQHSKSGKITLLAVSSDKRTPQLPDLPTIAESYPGFRSGTWNGYLAPAGTPEPIVQRLAQEVAKAVREPATAERLRGIGVEPLGNTPTEFAEYVRRDAPVWRDAVKAAGLKPE
jgi:tripartite-type tricarboxylate transporter receptor subunit TctC